MDIVGISLLIILYAIPLVFAITIHEAAHGWVAKQLGDYTAYSLGRITLNPIKHIDPVGTILVPIGFYVLTGFVFGWAKPVPINFSALRNPKEDSIYVAAAGPASNFLMALIWSMIISLATVFQLDFLIKMAYFGVLINVILMVFNLIPILPLDGGRVLAGLLPPKLSYEFSKTEKWGMLVIIVLAITGVIGKFIFPFVLEMTKLIIFVN